MLPGQGRLEQIFGFIYFLFGFSLASFHGKYSGFAGIDGYCQK